MFAEVCNQSVIGHRDKYGGNLKTHLKTKMSGSQTDTCNKLFSVPSEY